MNVRLIHPSRKSSSYFYFDGVTAQRAVELTRLHAAAQCVSCAYLEVREDVSLLEPPVLVAPFEVSA